VARAADAPYDGTWKVIFLSGRQEETLFILKAEHHAAGPKLERVAGQGPFAQVNLAPEKSSKDALRFLATAPNIVPLKFVAYAPKGEAAPKQMLGSVDVRGNRVMVRLERTEDQELDKNANKQNPAIQDYIKAMNQKDAKEKEAALKDLVEK